MPTCLGTVLVTGASSGIGLALAKIFAADGNSLILTARTVAPMETLAAECKALGSPRVDIIPVDLSIAGTPNELAREIAQRNLVVDALVNNAGFGTHGPLWQTDEAESVAMLQLNIVSLAHLTRLFLPGMVERNKGWILNVASTAAFQPGPLMAGYYASKAFVLSFSEAVSFEMKRTNVIVTALCPGPTHTNFQQRAGIAHSKLFEKAGTPVDLVAREAYAGLLKGKRVVIPGWKNRVLALSTKFSPKSTVMRVVKKLNEGR